MSQPIDEADKVGNDPTLPFSLRKAAGMLKQWEIGEIAGCKVAFGFCSSHSARPELVGRRVTTSEIVRDASEDGYIETLNTVYYLADRAQE